MRTDLTMSEDLALSENTNPVILKAQQHLFYLQKLEQANLLQKLLVNCYYCAIQNVLTYSMSVWLHKGWAAGTSKVDKICRRDRWGPTTRYHHSRPAAACAKPNGIIKGHFHPVHYLFFPLSSGKRFRSIRGTVNKDEQ